MVLWFKLRMCSYKNTMVFVKCCTYWLLFMYLTKICRSNGIACVAGLCAAVEGCDATAVDFVVAAGSITQKLFLLPLIKLYGRCSFLTRLVKGRRQSLQACTKATNYYAHYLPATCFTVIFILGFNYCCAGN